MGACCLLACGVRRLCSTIAEFSQQLGGDSINLFGRCRSWLIHKLMSFCEATTWAHNSYGCCVGHLGFQHVKLSQTDATWRYAPLESWKVCKATEAIGVALERAGVCLLDYVNAHSSEQFKRAGPEKSFPIGSTPKRYCATSPRRAALPIYHFGFPHSY